jgi:hypothetical protein
MRDNQLIQVFLPIINAALVDRGYPEVATIAANQPTQQGINTGPTVYFYKIGDHRYGWVSKDYVYDELLDQMIHTEVQFYETTFQISALVLQDPNTPNQYTASDLVNEVAAILQSDATIETLYNNDVGILRISDITNGYFTDDRDTFEASPSFDFILTHRQTRQSIANSISDTELDLFRV